jgi:hypothetical protein
VFSYGLALPGKSRQGLNICNKQDSPFLTKSL